MTIEEVDRPAARFGGETMSAYVKSGTTVTPGITQFLEVVGLRACSMMFEDPGNLGASPIDYVQLGDINVLRHHGSGRQQCVRQREHIAVDHMDYFLVSMPIRTRYRLRYQGEMKEAPPQSFVILSTTTPFQGSLEELSGHSSFFVVNVRIPGPLIRHRVPLIDELCGNFLHITPGVARAMQASFHTALEDGPFMNEASARSFGAAVLDLVCATAAERLDSALGSKRCLTIGDQILQRAKSFIDANLSNPELGPQEVAEHCRVSTRHLHTLFTSGASGLSCFNYIRDIRLLRCREALRQDLLRHRNVAEIAADWGYLHPSGFTRLYKAKFGKTPSEERSAIPARKSTCPPT